MNLVTAARYFLSYWWLFAAVLTKVNLADYVDSTCDNYEGRHKSFAKWADEETNAKSAARCRELLLESLSNASRAYSVYKGSNVDKGVIHILDAGCGSGRDLAAFEKEHVTLHTTTTKNLTLPVEASGFDCSKGFIEICRKRELSAVVADFNSYFSLIRDDTKYDGIFSLASLFHLPESDLVKTLKKFHDHLQPYGVILTTIPLGSRDELGGDGRWMLSLPEKRQKVLLEKAGFDVVLSKKISIYNGNDWLVLVGRKDWKNELDANLA